MRSLPRRAQVEELLAGLGADNGWATVQDANSISSLATGATDGVAEGPSNGSNPSTSVGAASTDSVTGSASSSGTCSSNPAVTAPGTVGGNNDTSTLVFAARLNSMRARRDLVDSSDARQAQDNVLGWIARQGAAKVLGVVYLNYPEHLLHEVDGATVTVTQVS